MKHTDLLKITDAEDLDGDDDVELTEGWDTIIID